MDRDFSLLSVSLTFAPGSGDNALMCSSVNVLSDSITEPEEDFTIALALMTTGDSLHLGNNVTTVTHVDDDGKRIVKTFSPK